MDIIELEDVRMEMLDGRSIDDALTHASGIILSTRRALEKEAQALRAAQAELMDLRKRNEALHQRCMSIGA